MHEYRTFARIGASKRPAFRCRAAAWLAASMLSAAPIAATACGYHAGPGAGLVIAHPSSLQVAMAIGSAVGTGGLRALPEGSGPLALLRATGTMRTFAGAIDAAAEGLPPIALVLVEAHLWGRIATVAGVTHLATHVDGPSGGDLVVVTGEHALRALLDGRLAWDAALATGLVVLDGPPAARERLARQLSLRFT
jgi:hypothetical protein